METGAIDANAELRSIETRSAAPLPHLRGSACRSLPAYGPWLRRSTKSVSNAGMPDKLLLMQRCRAVWSDLSPAELESERRERLRTDFDMRAEGNR
jgi:hypothetical protein